MKLLRIVSNGHHTYFEVDGKMYGEDVKSVIFTHDTYKEHFDGYSYPVLQIKLDDGTTFDSRFDSEIPAKPMDMNDIFDHSFEGISKIFADVMQDKDNTESMCWNEAKNNKRDAEMKQFREQLKKDHECIEMKRRLQEMLDDGEGEK